MKKLVAQLLIMSTLPWLTAPTSAFEKIVVVVHRDNPVDEMTRSEVIDLFMGKYVAFPNGEKAIATDLDGEQATKKLFYEKLVGRSLSSINSYWSRIRFTGRTRPSIPQPNEDEIVSFVQNNNMAIGYISASKVNNQLKVVYELDE